MSSIMDLNIHMLYLISLAATLGPCYHGFSSAIMKFPKKFSKVEPPFDSHCFNALPKIIILIIIFNYHYSNRICTFLIFFSRCISGYHTWVCIISMYLLSKIVQKHYTEFTFYRVFKFELTL